MEIEEMRIEWVSDNGIWKVIGRVKAHPFQKDFAVRDINIFKEVKGRRTHELYSIGRYRKQTPAYVMEKYNEIHDEIRGRRGSS